MPGWDGRYNNMYLDLRLSLRETLENPVHSRDNGSVIAGKDWGNGRQAGLLLGLRADDGQDAGQTGEVSFLDGGGVAPS